MAGFNTAVTGLKAATTDLDVTGNNIANSSTVGFKASRTEFGDIYATAVVGAGAANIAGSGVTVSDIAQDFKAGTIEFTNNNLDLAINGSGFFQLDDGQGGITYTRGGSFELDKDGFIVSKNGKFLQGFGLDNQGNQLPLGNLAVTQKESPPKATEEIGLSFNIDSRADAQTLQQPYNKDEPGSFTYSSTVRTFDSLGNEHTIKYNFVEQPAHREVQTVQLAAGDFDDLSDQVDISGVTLNTAILQKAVGWQAEDGAIGEVRGVHIDNGTDYLGAAGDGKIQLDFNFSGTAFSISGIDNGTGGGNYDADTEFATLLASEVDHKIIAAYNDAKAPSQPRLVGIAVDPSDNTNVLFQFDNTASAPAVSFTVNGAAAAGATDVATSLPPGAEWGGGSTLNVGNEVTNLLNGDPRIAQIEVNEQDPTKLTLRFKADATDVDPVIVQDSTTKNIRTDVTINSSTLSASEVHTYSFNPDAFDTNGLVARTTVTIGGVDVVLTQGASQQAVAQTITSFQQVILDANPDLESVTFNSDNQLVVTFKPEAGNVNDLTAIEINMGDSDTTPGADPITTVFSGPEVVSGDNSYRGVYRMYAYLNGSELLDIGKDVEPGESGFLGWQEENNPTEPGPIIIKFNPTNGLLSSINGTLVTPNTKAPSISILGADPANPGTEVTLDLTGATQFASSSIVKSSSQDGYTKGDLIGVSFSEDGKMVASFSNGQNQSLGIVAIATFENQSGLTPMGDTEWSATLDSGDATLNPPGTGLNGTLRSAALEQSNVDLSEELVRLIEAQRNFQANSKTLETLNTVTQNILQI